MANPRSLPSDNTKELGNEAEGPADSSGSGKLAHPQNSRGPGGDQMYRHACTHAPKVNIAGTTGAVKMPVCRDGRKSWRSGK